MSFLLLSQTKIISTILIVISILSIVRCENNQINESECLIHNIKYRYEYLYHSKKIDKQNNSKVYTNRLTDANDFNRLKWKQIYLNQSNETNFLLANDLENQFLCASFKLNLIKTKRSVYMSSKLLTNGCVWRLEYMRKRFSNRIVLIWNVEYDKALYADYLISLFGLGNRNLYLWDKKFEPKNDIEFLWSFDCRKGAFLLS